MNQYSWVCHVAVMKLILRQPGARNDKGLNYKMIVVFLPRKGSVQSSILSYKMKRFHFCTWSSVPLIMTYASNSSTFYQQPCANGGRCVLNNASSYTCICTPGWSGQNCRINVNDCVRHWCQNGATCVDEIDGYRWAFKSWLSSGHSGTRMSMIVKAVTFAVPFLQGWKNSFYSVQY